MYFDYYGFYGLPGSYFLRGGVGIFIVGSVAVLLAIVLYFTFLSPKKEGCYRGWKEKFYNFMNINHFYTENVLKFIYVISACLLTVVGLYLVIVGKFLLGAGLLLIGNLVLRVITELFMMFVILCRKTVSIDKRMSRIEKFYTDEYGEEGYCENDFEDEGSCCASSETKVGEDYAGVCGFADVCNVCGGEGCMEKNQESQNQMGQEDECEKSIEL